MKKELLKERNRISNICEKIKRELKEKKYEGLPTLRVSRSHGTYQYHVENYYISKKRIEYIERLVRKEYYDRLLKNLEIYCKKCDELLELIDSKVQDKAYNDLSRGKQRVLTNALFLPVSEQIKAFEEETFDKNEIKYDILTEIYTNKGELVRSKSEKIIADELYRRGIPYHYEKPLVLNDRGKRIVIYPDFTVMNIDTGKILYLEHLGLMDQPEYCKMVIKKINLFEKNGLLIGRDVLLFHESSNEPLNIRTLNQYLDEFLQ